MNGYLLELSFAQALAGLVFILALYYLRSVARWKARTRGLPLPPGPNGLPILGNLYNVPTSKPWLGHNAVSMQYGSE